MPTIKFRMKAIYGERIDDLLLSYNDGKQEADQYTDISQWERAAIREFLSNPNIGLMAQYRSWETNGKIINPRTSKQVDAPLEINIDEIPLEADTEDEKARPYIRALNLGASTTLWLRRTSAFNLGITRFLNTLNKSELLEIVHPVSHVISDVLDDASWKAVVKLDTIDLEEDEKQLKAEMKKQEVKPIGKS